MTNQQNDGRMNFDSELWIFFSTPFTEPGMPTDWKLVRIDSDPSAVIRPMCVIKSTSSSSDSSVEAWSPHVTLNQAAEGVVTIGIRIQSNDIVMSKDEVTWTVVLSSHETEARFTFKTHSMLDEGFTSTSVGENDFRIRFLLIHNAQAEIIPTSLDRTWLHSLPTHQTLMAGHRGLGSDPATEKENSLAAFLSAHQIGADLVELDVQLTEDGRLCVYHDLSLPVTADDEKTLVRDLSWTELKRRIPHVTELSEVLEKVNTELGIDVEVKYPMNQMSGDVESDENYSTLMTEDGGGTGITRRWSKNRLVDAVLLHLRPAMKTRRLFLSTFQPDLALIMSRKLSSVERIHLPVIFLTRGETHPENGTPHQHSDPRSKSVDAGIAWAHVAGLDGVAPFAESVLGLDLPAMKFSRDKMVAVLWGSKLNSVSLLRKLRDEGWPSVLIFDRIDQLLADVRG